MQEYKKISSKEAKEIIENEKDILIVDVRDEHSYKNTHIKGAINIPMNQLNNISSLIENKDQKLLIYCHHGIASRICTSILVQMGYKNTIDMGGIDKYEGEKE